MGSRPARDSESPSASSFFLPQFRQSRRGSIASLSSVNQIDKEALSQALDEIHSTASRSDTLTTFNEYTSPPASTSGLDNKGIASELQGGISGLYNRFRASVGNAKDVLVAGGEDDAVDRLSVTSLSKSSPAPSIKGAVLPSRGIVQTTASGHEPAQPESGRQSPFATSSVKSSITESAKGGRQSSSQTQPDSIVSTVLPPQKISQALGTGVRGFVSTDRKSALPSAGVLASGNTFTPSGPSGKDDDSQSRKGQPERSTTLKKIDSFATRGSIKEQGKDDLGAAPQSPVIDRNPNEDDGQDLRSSDRGDYSSSPMARTQFSKPQPSSEDVQGSADVTTNSPGQPSPNVDTDRANMSSNPTSRYDRDQKNSLMYIETNKNTTTTSKNREGILRHLEVPARKSMAPPLISRNQSPDPRLSRASSSDTNTDSLASAPRNLIQRQGPSGLKDGAKTMNQSLPMAQAALQRDPRMMNVFSQARNKVLNKEYWMKDENARDCFNCGDPFSTFRRKHHCRICGQIFDAKCTSILAGEHFGHSGPLRVCRPCEGVIKGNDDSSEFSDDGGLAAPTFRPRHGSTGASDVFTGPSAKSTADEPESFRQSPGHPDLTVPTMSIPATRKAGEKAGRKPTVLEIGASHSLGRPSSSRSLKSAFGSRSHGGGHRRHNSRHLQRSFRSVREDDAPFHQTIATHRSKEAQLPTFHDDNIIDPDLAPFLSEEDSSGDEQMSIMAALNGDNLSRSYDNDRHGLPGLMSSSRKGRSRAGDKSMSAVAFASRDSDNHSIHSAKMANPPRSAKRRNLSFSGNNHLRPSPRSYRATLTTPGSGLNLHNLHESPSNTSLAQMAPNADQSGLSRMIRSSSMRGDAAPAIELNTASLRHVRRLLHQLLEDSKVPNMASWEKALIPILLRATDDVNPDVQNGDDIDIRHYVKLKKIPGGRPGDTSYVSGLVFTKNLALKSMPRSISHPNILVLTFPLVYARHQQHFMSLEPVIRQEREFLQNLVNRIAALRPQLLLVERNVSGLAMEFLAQAGIATAYNVKSSVLEAVSRCCQTRIISSIDKLAIKPAHAGKCASFYLKTYVNGNRKKTYMFLSGCAKELGCTIVLRGDDAAMLSKMKRITEFMIYVVYNLKLETCLMRDEYAAIPVVIGVGSLSPSKDHPPRAKLPDPPSIKQVDGSGTVSSVQIAQTIKSDYTGASEAHGDSLELTTQSETVSEKPPISLPEEDSVPDDVPMPTFYGDMVEEHKTKILSASPFVKFMQPYLLMRAREQERRLAYLKRLCDQDILDDQKGDEKPKVEKFDLIKPEMVHETVPNASRKVREVLHAVHDAEYDKALHIYQTQTKQWETYIAGSIDLFDPYAHQNIAVLYSIVCTVTTVPCSGPDLLALGFYNEHEVDADFEADCTLGQYVEDLCLGANTVCTSNGCEKKMAEHHRQYVHGEAQLSVFVERYPCKIPGAEDTILMWNVCRICSKETPVMQMTENTWKYSFGKYLELSFWSSDLRARADICPHDLHRDHLRYFGFKDMALRVHYDPITLLEIIVPRARITWKVDNDLRFKNELFTRIEERLNRFMLSVRARIKNINTQSVVPEKIEACKEEIERLSKKASEEHHRLIQKLRKRYMNSKHFEIVPLNRAIRATQEKVAEWDSAFAELDRNYLPSEKDIRRLATVQLKTIFLEQENSDKTGGGVDGNTKSSAQEILNEKLSAGETPVLAPQTRDMSPEKAHDMLASVVEKHVALEGQPKEKQDIASTTEHQDHGNPAHDLPAAVEGDGVRPLELAMSSDLSGKIREEQQPTSSPSETKSTTNSGEVEDNAKISVPGDAVPDSEGRSQQQEIKTSEPVPTSERTQASGIPRPVELQHRNTRSNLSQTPSRTQSQPGHIRSKNSSTDSSQGDLDTLQSTDIDPKPLVLQRTPTNSRPSKPVDKKLSDRLGLNALKVGGAVAHSMIPRSIGGRRRNESKVSSLAKHFEQLSREFERERIKERRQRAANSRQSRAYPMAASKPIVQVYKNVHEAVEEKDPSEEELLSSDPSQGDQEEHVKTSQAMAENQVSKTAGEGFHAEETTADNTDPEENVNDDSRINFDKDVGEESDEDYTIFDDLEIPGTADEHHALTQEEAQLDLKLDLPKHEKSSLMKMLNSFWAERSASGWQPLEYPLNATDHIFADSDIIVREDEPSSLIALALNSEDYQSKLSTISDSTQASTSKDEDGELQDPLTGADDQVNVEQSLLRPTGTHLKYQFSESSAKMLCKVFYAEQFDAVRRKCGVSERFVESLSRCMKWDSKGGKTKSVFLKTLDDRFVLKSLSQIETQAFLRFAPAYFRIMSESLFHELPSVIAKMLGFYQVIIKNPITGVEFNWFLLVMENLFYDRSPTRIFDLKGSMRNRRIQSTGEQNEVLLDENMVEFIYESPLFSREHSKKLLRASVWNDTLFLSRQNVMDYSLMIAIDEERRELVVGIIDCIRTYTWDKKLESWIKDRGKNRPTVTSPKEYKSRFREAMGRYVLQAPNCWHHFEGQRVERRMDDPGNDKDVQVVGL